MSRLTKRPTFRRPVLAASAAAFVAVLAVTGVALAPAASAEPASAGARACKTETAPAWFFTEMKRAARVSGDRVPSSWGTSKNMSRIVHKESRYCPKATNGQYYGLGQMNRSAVVNEAGVSWSRYRNGTSAHPARYYQLLAALRYCERRYGSPANAWAHHQSHGWW
jgi:hypothetical protein